MITHKKIFLINSRDRESGTDSDFMYKLDVQPEDKFDRCCILQASIPKSYFMVNSTESFTLTENGTSVSISLPSGNYNRTSLRTKLQTVLNSLSPNGWVYTITNPNPSTEPDTGKYKWTVAGNSDLQPTFTFTNQLFEQFGFDRNSVNVFVSNELISTNVIKLQEDTIYLHSSICQASDDNVLQEFYTISTQTFASIHFDNFSGIEAYSKPIASNSSNLYRFNLTNEDDIPIDLNGLNVQFTLMCYRTNNIWDILKQFIGLVTSRLDS